MKRGPVGPVCSFVGNQFSCFLEVSPKLIWGLSAVLKASIELGEEGRSLNGVTDAEGVVGLLDEWEQVVVVGHVL